MVLAFVAVLQVKQRSLQTEMVTSCVIIAIKRIEYLSNIIMNDDFRGKEVYVTLGQKVSTTAERDDMYLISPCSHEEADTRVVLHAANAARRGCEKDL